MREALLIAKREYLERVRSKAFLFTTLLLPLLMGGIMAGSIFAASQGGGVKHLVVASNSLRLAIAVKEEMDSKQPKPVVEVLAPAMEQDRERLIERVDAKQLDGYLWLQAKDGAPIPEATFASRSSADFFTAGRLQDAVGKAVMRQQLLGRGLSAKDVEALMKSVDVKTLQVKEGKAASSDSARSFFGAYIMIMLLYFTVIFYGMNVARSVVEEKTSRIFEVLLATARPESLMAGKLLGVGAAGLTQIGIWFSLAFLYTGSVMAARAGMSGGLAAFGITGTQVVFFVLYFVLGFLFYSAISAGLGASVSTEQEVQQFSIVIVLPLLIGLVMMTYVLSNPSAPLSVALSLFPPCTPIVMYLRLASQQPPMWQLVLSVALMLLAIWAAVWVASRIYRVGILMYGKRATLPEMLRWMRYS